jgi:tetratricopeptide (TPR) repeat protein
MVSRSANTAVASLLILGGFAAAFFLTGFVERHRPALPAGYEDEDVALKGSQFKGFAFGAEGLISDWYWMNSLQYIGKKISTVGLNNLNLEDMTSLNPRLLYPYLNSSTDLDPHFIAPYSYGATILPAIDPQQAIALTEKGIVNNPEQWRLYQYLGYIYWKLGNYEKASEIYGKGSQIAGAPIFMRMMSARMKTEGGSRDIAREMYTQLRDEAEDERSRENAELRLLQIDSLDERDLIGAALSEFRQANNRCPANWRELLPTLQKKSAGGRELRIDRSDNIVDPSGVPYFLNTQNCTVELGAATKIPRV